MKNSRAIIVVLILFISSCGQRSVDKSIENILEEKAPENETITEAQRCETPDFREFLECFLDVCFWGNNTDSLIYVSSPSIKQFVHDEIGLGRFTSPVEMCDFFEDASQKTEIFDKDYWGERNPVKGDPTFFADRLPIKPECENTPSPDGIYYKKVSRLPSVTDENLEEVKITLPAKHRKSAMMLVDIVQSKDITKSFYFVQVGNAWYLAYIHDCSC